jgi:hypothetical protein
MVGGGRRNLPQPRRNNRMTDDDEARFKSNETT